MTEPMERLGARRRRRLHRRAGGRGGAAARPRGDRRARRAAARELRGPRRTCSPSWSREDVEVRDPGSRGGENREGRRPHRDQGRRVPGRADARGRPGADRARPRRADPEGRRRGERDQRRRLRGAGRADRPDVEDVFARGRPDPRRQGAPAAGGRAPSPGRDPVHLPAPRPGAGADAGPVRVGRHLRRLRDRGGQQGPATPPRADERDRGQDRDAGGRVHAREAARRQGHSARAACPASRPRT